MTLDNFAPKGQRAPHFQLALKPSTLKFIKQRAAEKEKTPSAYVREMLEKLEEKYK